MMGHFRTETDQVFDDIIYKEAHPDVPQQQHFLHSTTATSQAVSSLKKKDKFPNENRLYTSPFRSTLAQGKLEWSANNKHKRYSHAVEYPEFLNALDQWQSEELNELKLKENKLAYYKASQDITKYDKSKYKYIKQPIPLESIPKVPYFTYESTKEKPRNDKASKSIAKQNNPWATPENKEKIIIYKGKLYSKPVFDNVRYDQSSHDRYISNQKRNCNDKKQQIEKEYSTKIGAIDNKIAKTNDSIKEIKSKHNKLEQFYENNLTKQYFDNIALYNKIKTDRLNHISKLKKAISETQMKNTDDRDSFESEIVEEIKYI